MKTIQLSNLKRLSQIKFDTIITTLDMRATYSHWDNGVPCFLINGDYWFKGSLKELRKHMTIDTKLTN